MHSVNQHFDIRIEVIVFDQGELVGSAFAEAILVLIARVVEWPIEVIIV